MKTTTGYSGLQIGLHWLIAILIVTAWFTGEGAGEAMETVENGGVAGFVPHVAFGLAILALVVVRVLVRLGRGARGVLLEGHGGLGGGLRRPAGARDGLVAGGAAAEAGRLLRRHAHDHGGRVWAVPVRAVGRG